MGLFGGAPVHDLSSFTLRTRGDNHLPRTALSQDMALAPVDPVSSEGLSTQVSVLNSETVPVESVIKTAPQQFRGTAPRHVAPPASMDDGSVSSQGQRQSGTWAVVIGINDYPGSQNDLVSAVNDANDVVQALESLGVTGDHILELRDGQVTRSTLLQSVAWLSGHAATDAVAGFFYAGHVRKTGQGTEEIVTSDGGSVTDVELARALDHVQASRSWVAIAACYGGGFDEVLDKPGRVLTAAADRNSLAYENSSIGRSYMVEYMVRQAIIENRASATVESAFNYAVERISQEHPGREPVEFDTGNGALDLRPPGVAVNSQPTYDNSPPPPPPSDEPPSTEPPASDGGSGSGSGQHCTGKNLFRYCSNG
ncbi:MAG: hypothetical protein QOK28_2877 [Actinomycetota bacterium]|jgi:hypothetical protein